jgi:4-hydroxybenzoate polyprenyltransferase
MTESQRQTKTAYAAGSPSVLCVDLDGTLIRTDTLLESVMLFLKEGGIRALCLLCVWTLRGKACLKRNIAERIRFNPAELPYHEELLAFLKAERAAGARLVLATGADERLARLIADHLGIFDEVLASDGKTNLTSSRKMRALVDRFGARGFRYVGNSRADLPVWRQAGQAIICCTGNALPRRVQREGIPTGRVFQERHHRFGLLAAALRLYQWPKNLLIWVPLFLSHRMGEPALILKGVVAMTAFSFCASALYLVNDLLDLTADRAHPRKCSRPFASGRLNPWIGVALAPALTLASLIMAWLLSPDFLTVLALYAACSVAYSFFFKEAPLLDVCLLGWLYVVRIFAGGAAMNIVISSWTLGYCMFLFLSLALLKRYVELLMLSATKQNAVRGRGYVIADSPIVACFGAGTACVAALLLALYIESPEVRLLYRHPQRLWLLCGLHIYWIARTWLLANRGQMHHDPVLFALRDRTSYWLGAASAVVAWLAT